jgi:pyruvate dehydrogenase E2 component (dihydrolipoamide acetyltransferase)
MPTSVTMPRLGESVTEGTVTRWLKQEGEHVDVDEPLLEVSTDKVDTEVPSPVAGTVLSIKVAEDETVDIGVELVVIADEAEAGDGAPAPEPTPDPEPEVAPTPVQQDAETARKTVDYDDAPSDDADEDAGAYVTPLVRKLASENNVDLSAVKGTGVGGRIRKSDVLAAAGAKPAAAPASTSPAVTPTPPAAAPAPAAAAPPAPKPAPAPTAAAPSAPAPTVAVRGRTEKLSRRRALIAARMIESLQTSAQLTTVVEVDVTKVARQRTAAKADFEAREGVKLSFLPFFALATIEALKAHPGINASIDTAAGTVTYHDSVNLGIAVDTDSGLVVPVIHEAGDLNLGGIARKIADVAARTRGNKISPDDLSGATFSLTNTGSRGALFDTPIFTPPQVAILGTGSVVKRPVVVSDPNIGETIAVRSMVYLALSYDHQIVDGADAARFLGTIKERLESGSFEGELGLS